MAKPPKLAHVKFVRAKGKVYPYFNTGKKVDGKTVYAPLPPFGTVGFYDSYTAMLGHRARRGEVILTVADLIDRYQSSEEWKALSKGSQQLYRLTLNRVREQIGKFPIERVERVHIREILDNRLSGNGARNIFLKLVGVLYKWARERDLVPEHKNPVAGIKPYKIGAHDPWPEAVLDAALKADDERVRLAVHLLYFPGQRIGDVMKMRWSDVRNGAIWITQQKTGKELRIPIHSRLEAELARTPKRGIAIITNWKGRPMRPDVVRKEIKEFAAALGADVVPHGLRKSAVNALLMAGCTVQEVMAITGQSPRMVEYYARKIDQHRLGDAAILKLERKANGETKWKTG